MMKSCEMARGVPLSEEAVERGRRAQARYLEVFGDDDWLPNWLLRNDHSFGVDEIGMPFTPMGLARRSEEGLQKVLGMLDDLAKTTKPRWKQRLNGQNSSRRRRSVR